MMSQIANWLRVGCCLLLLGLSGCGARRQPASASGTVKYGGEAIAAGSIRFDPVDANDALPVGGQIKDGKYEFPVEAGLVEGEYFVAIYATRETGRTVAPAEALNNTPNTPSKEVEQYIPEIYNASTSLKAALKAGANADKNFELQLGEKPKSSNPTTPGQPTDGF